MREEDRVDECVEEGSSVVGDDANEIERKGSRVGDSSRGRDVELRWEVGGAAEVDGEGFGLEEGEERIEARRAG